MKADELKALIRDVPDFPKPGILFKDITPLLAHPQGLSSCARLLGSIVEESGAEEIVAIDARGFLFGAAVAATLNMPLQIVRKPGKLPYERAGVDYDLEYGSDRVEIHRDAIVAGRRYVVMDDLLATGGTAGAAVELVQEQGGLVACCVFVIELRFLAGREKLSDRPVHSLIEY